MKQKRLEKLSDSEDSARGDKKNMSVGGSSTATKTSPTKAATEPPLHMGVNLNNQNMVEKLKDLKEIRAEFDVKQKKHEKSLKKENQRRKRQSQFGPDAVTSVTALTTTYNSKAGDNSSHGGIVNDYGWTQKPRAFKNKTPLLSNFGVSDFDQKKEIRDLKFTMQPEY